MPGLSTRAIHGGERPDPTTESLNTPIVASTTYRYPERTDGGKSSHIYSRYDNPTVQAAEGKMAALEGSDGALAFASGMGAIACVLETFLGPGDHVAVMQGVYGGTMAHLNREVAGRGVHVRRFDPSAPDQADLKGVQVVWLESIGNPMLRVPDITAWADAAHDAGALLVVDATFATPVLQRPLELGADVVVHSATKFLAGHSDVTAGFVCYREEHHDSLWTTRRNTGATMDPMAADRVMRGMKTLPLRVREQCRTAQALAEHLSARDLIVHYPGLESHPDHAHARSLDGYGAVMTIDVGTKERAIDFRRKVKVFAPAASLGGVESLVSLPIETSHAYSSDDERTDEGITDGLLRLSIGLEDLEDLRADIEAALD